MRYGTIVPFSLNMLEGHVIAGCLDRLPVNGAPGPGPVEALSPELPEIKKKSGI